MDISICVGSSCHLKGSYDVIEGFQKLLKQHEMEEKVNLKATFCLGHCTNGVAVKVDNEFIEGVSKENVEEMFHKHILICKSER